MASPIGRVILQLLDRHGMTRKAVAQAAGIDPSNLTKIIAGTLGTKGPTRARIAQAFNLRLEEFDAMWSGTVAPRDPDEHAADERPAGRIPVINSAPAGEVVNYEEWGVDSRDGFRYIDRGSLVGGNLFAVEVVGESMETALFAGDEVVLRWMDPHQDGGHEPLHDGTVVFVRFSDDAPRAGCTLARWYFNRDRITLRKDNPRFPPETYSREAISQVGKFVQRRTGRV